MTTHSNSKRALVEAITQNLKNNGYSVPGELWIYLILCDESELEEIARKLDVQLF